jgi:isopentenyldiphosphate isomerase
MLYKTWDTKRLSGFFCTFDDTMNFQHPDELFPVVDENGNTIGEARRSVCHDGISKLLHPVVHLHLFNYDGRLFLQKRSLSKDVQPGKWDTSVGGHVAPGEKVEDALRREALEELGIVIGEAVFIGRYVWESSVERELVNSFTIVSDQLPEINQDEIEEGRYWSADEIMNSLGKGMFTPNFENECRILIEKCFLSTGNAK